MSEFVVLLASALAFWPFPLSFGPVLAAFLLGVAGTGDALPGVAAIAENRVWTAAQPVFDVDHPVRSNNDRDPQALRTALFHSRPTRIGRWQSGSV